MAKVIGYVKNVEGKFLAKGPDGHTRALKAGDPIYANEIVYDPSHRSDHKLVVTVKGTGQELVLNGEQQVKLNETVINGETNKEEAQNEKGGNEHEGAKEQQASNQQSSEHHAGQTQGREGATHGNQAELDVTQTAAGRENSGTQNSNMAAAPHDYSIAAQTETFMTVDEQSNTVIAVPEVAPIHLAPLFFASHAPIVDMQPTEPVPPLTPIFTPIDTTTYNTFQIVDPNNDGYINASEASDFRIVGRTEPGSTLLITISDGEHTIEVPQNEIAYNPVTGVFQVTGVDIAGLQDGTITVNVTNTDTAGNTAVTSETIIKDATPPTVEIVSISEDSGTPGDFLTNDNTLIFNGKADPNSIVEIKLDGHTIATTEVNGNGEWSYDYSEHTLSDGVHTLEVQAKDEAGNLSNVDDKEITIVHAPEASFDQLTETALQYMDDLDDGIVFNFNAEGQDVGQAEIHYMNGHQILAMDAYLAEPYATDLQKVCSLVKEVYLGNDSITLTDKAANFHGDVAGEFLMADHGNYVDLSVVEMTVAAVANQSAGKIDVTASVTAYNEVVDSQGGLVDRSANYQQSESIDVPVKDFDETNHTITIDGGELKANLSVLLTEQFGEELVDQLREIIEQTDARCNISSNPESAPELTGQTYFDVAFQGSTAGEPTFTMKIVEDYHHQV